MIRYLIAKTLEDFKNNECTENEARDYILNDIYEDSTILIADNLLDEQKVELLRKIFHACTLEQIQDIIKQLKLQ